MEYKFTLIDGEVETVIDEPIGWDKCKITYARDDKYHGIFTSYTDELEFVNDGYTIIANAFYTYGIEYLLKIRIEQRCNASYEYQTLYTGRVNLAGFQDRFNIFCSCITNIEQDSNTMLMKNNSDKIVDFSKVLHLTDESLPPLLPNTMTMHSKAIVLTSVFDTVTESVPLIAETVNIDVSQTYFLPMPVYVKSNDLSISSTTGINAQLIENITTDIALIEPTFIPAYDGVYDLIFECEGSFVDSITTALGRSYNLQWTYSINGTPYSIYDIGAQNPLSPLTVLFDINETLSLTLNANDVVKIYLVIANYSVPTSSISYFYLLFNTANIYFKSETETPSSTAKTYMIHECFERVAQNALDKRTAFKSNFLGRKDLGYGANGCGSFMALTNGFNIRSFDKPILANLTDIYSSLSAVHCLGLGLENDGGNEIIRVEPVSYFYNETNINDITNIKSINVSVDQNRVFNTVKIGFEKEGTEEGTDKSNTLDGFATNHSYSLPITTVKREFVNVCKYVADHYAIEFTRRVQYLETSTSSWKFDDDNFLICTKRTESVSGYATELNLAERNENFSTQNILSPGTGYNLRLTPMRMMLNWNQIISGAYAKIAGKSAQFTNGKNNYLYESQLIGNCTDRYNNAVLKENQNLAWDDENNLINSPIYEPISIKFDYPMSLSNFNYMIDNKYGYYSVGKGSTIEHRGYIKMVTFMPVQGMANFDLIKLYGNEPQCDLIYVECPYVVDEYVE
jgi:hypothetical protein